MILLHAILIVLLIPYPLIGLLIVVFGRKQSLIKDYSIRPTVSIFLPTWNEEGYIGKKLEDLLSQTYPIEEILVYDCSTDKTPTIVKEYSRDHPEIKLIRQPNRTGMPRTFDQAIAEAKGEIFVKTDCDSLTVSKDSLRELVATFGDHEIGAVSGVCTSKSGVEKWYHKFMRWLQVAETRLDSTIVARSTSLLAFRRELTSPVRYDSIAEDTEEFVLIRRGGHRTVIDTSVIAEEEVPQSIRKRRKQKDRRAQHIITSLLIHKDMFFNKRYGMYGLVVFPLNFYLLVITPIVMLISSASIAYLIFIASPLLAASLALIMGIMLLMRIGPWLAIIDIMISGLVATLRLIVRRDSSMWEKVR